ncbi:hypothetical protein HispidOSU_008015 [Sigmodon hispidus]
MAKRDFPTTSPLAQRCARTPARLLLHAPTLTCHGKRSSRSSEASKNVALGLGDAAGQRRAADPGAPFLSEARAAQGADLCPAPETGNRKRPEAAEQLLLLLDPAACDRGTFAPPFLFLDADWLTFEPRLQALSAGDPHSRGGHVPGFRLGRVEGNTRRRAAAEITESVAPWAPWEL